MTQYLEDYSLIKNSTVDALIKAAFHYGALSDSHKAAIIESVKALNQDLSGTLNAPITPTEKMIDVGEKIIDLYGHSARAQDVYTAMIYAGQKEENDD